MNRIVPQALIEYLFLFHYKRDYFECHEVLEEYWKNEGEKNDIWSGLIQVAAAFYHYRRGNVRGAYKLAKKALSNLMKEEQQLRKLGFHSKKFFTILEQMIENSKNGLPYKSIDLPLNDPYIKKLYENYCEEKGGKQPIESELCPFIIHKHRLRDRTTIVQNRKRALLMKKRDR